VQRVEEVGKSEGRPLIGRISHRKVEIPNPKEPALSAAEGVQTSDWCLVTRKFGELPQGGKHKSAGLWPQLVRPLVE